jgi:hypothetical protein
LPFDDLGRLDIAPKKVIAKKDHAEKKVRIWALRSFRKAMCHIESGMSATALLAGWLDSAVV